VRFPARIEPGGFFRSPVIVTPRAMGWAIAEKTFGFGKTIAAVAERVAHATMRLSGAASK
jgi:hypothetical protein